MERIPVFFINGILESGKTTFTLDTIHSDGFDGKTLLISCEQGEIEYDEDDLDYYNTSLIYFKSVDEFNEKNLNDLIQKYEPNRVVIEMNGMWDLNKIQFPYYMELLQVITFIDTTTFEIYFNNMRQKFNDMISRSDAVVFIKCEDSTKQIEPYKAQLKVMNSNCDFYIMDENEKARVAFVVPLPYDLNSDVVKINYEDYPLFYMDTFDNRKNYINKVVEYDSMVFLSDKLEPNTFIAGRMIMSCCENDMQLFGFLVKSNLNMNLKNKSWIRIKARIEVEYSSQYNEEEVVLYPIEITEIEDKESVMDLSKN